MIGHELMSSLWTSWLQLYWLSTILTSARLKTLRSSVIVSFVWLWPLTCWPSVSDWHIVCSMSREFELFWDFSFLASLKVWRCCWVELPCVWCMNFIEFVDLWPYNYSYWRQPLDIGRYSCHDNCGPHTASNIAAHVNSNILNVHHTFIKDVLVCIVTHWQNDW